MIEEMVGGQHHNDERDTESSARAEHTNANDRKRCSLQNSAPVCLEEANTPEKNLLQRPTSLEKPTCHCIEHAPEHRASSFFCRCAETYRDLALHDVITPAFAKCTSHVSRTEL